MVTRRQLQDLGMHPRAIDRRLKSRMLLPLLPGVYTVPWVKSSWWQKATAALLWAGDGAALAGISAAQVWRLDVDQTSSVSLKITRRLDVPAPWVRIHRVSAPDPRIKVDGLWVTKLETTLLDLGSILDEESLEDALESALRRSLTNFGKLQAFIEVDCARGRRGCKSLRNLLAERGDVPATESRFESRFNRLLRRAQLPLPQRQVVIRDGDRFIARVDFAYPTQKVVIEADGWLYHSGRRASHRDGSKGNDLGLLGWIVLRFTTEDLRDRPDEVVEMVREALGGRLFN